MRNVTTRQIWDSDCGRKSLLFLAFGSVANVASGGTDLYRLTEEIRLEVITTKRKASTYQPGRHSPDWLLEVSDPEYLPGERGFITFDESPLEEAGELRKSAVEKCERLAKAVTASNYEEASEALVETLLSVRNARVHAAFLKPGARSNVGGEPVTVRTTVGRRDYEIQIVAKILLSIGKILISKKTSRPLTEITELVDSRTCQLLKEIYKRVTAWGPQNRDFGPFNIV
jgi:hypothetical protein